MKHILTTLAIAFATLAQAQPTNGLVAKYSFSGNANDEVGSNHGTVHGATLTTDRFGTANKAYKFTNGEYITLPDAAALKSTTMTVSLWVKVGGFNSSNVGTNYIYSVINTPTNAYFAAFSMSYYSNGKYLNVSQNSSSQSVLGFSTIGCDSTWQHYVMGIDNDSIKMWVDGVYQWSQHKGFTTTYTTDSVYIGASGNTTYNGFLNASVDDIRVYSRMLNAADIDSLFNEPKPANVGISDNGQQTTVNRIYPNPTTGIVNMVDKCNVTVLDFTGNTVIQKKLTNSLDISDLPNGIYFLQMEDGSKVKICKIFKR